MIIPILLPNNTSNHKQVLPLHTNITNEINPPDIMKCHWKQNTTQTIVIPVVPNLLRKTTKDNSWFNTVGIKMFKIFWYTLEDKGVIYENQVIGFNPFEY